MNLKENESVIIFCVWNSIFMTAVITLPSVWVLIQVCFVANKEGKIINSKNYPLEQDYGLKNVGIARFRK